MLAGIERTAKAVAAMSDAPAPDIKITEGAKAVMNDAAVVEAAVKVMKALSATGWARRHLSPPARIFPNSSMPVCRRCFSTSASTSQNVLPPRATARARN